MRRYTKTKLDSNHRAICDELRSQGLEVIEIMEPVDTVMRFGSFVAFVELKPEGRGYVKRYCLSDAVDLFLLFGHLFNASMSASARFTARSASIWSTVRGVGLSGVLCGFRFTSRRCSKEISEPGTSITIS